MKHSKAAFGKYVYSWHIHCSYTCGYCT